MKIKKGSTQIYIGTGDHYVTTENLEVTVLKVTNKKYDEQLRGKEYLLEVVKDRLNLEGKNNRVGERFTVCHTNDFYKYKGSAVEPGYREGDWRFVGEDED